MTLSVQPSPHIWQDSIDSPSFDPKTVQPSSVEETRLSFEDLIREVFSLLRKQVREYRDTLHLLETYSQENWDASVQAQLSDMRDWTSLASKIGGIAISALGATTQIVPGAIKGGCEYLNRNGFLPDIVSRFQNNHNEFATAMHSAMGYVSSVHQHLDKTYDTRIEANRTEHTSLATLFQDHNQKFSAASQEEYRTINDLLEGINSIEQSIQQTLRQLAR